MCPLKLPKTVQSFLHSVGSAHVRQITRFNDFGDSKNYSASPVVPVLESCRVVESSHRPIVPSSMSICCPLLLVGRLIKLTPQSNQIQIKIARIWKVVATGGGRATNHQQGQDLSICCAVSCIISCSVSSSVSCLRLQSSQLQGARQAGRQAV